MRNQFTQNAGPIGPIATTPGTFVRVANPWVHRHMVSLANAGKIKTVVGAQKACCSSCAESQRR